MTNEKNNINELVTDDDDPTAELEVLVLDQRAPQQDADSESSANTYDYPNPDKFADGDGGETISELRSDLENRSKTIDRLQFDIEQLRAKWLGLEAEIGAREEITKRLNQELESANSSRGKIQSQIKKRDQSIKSLKAEIRERDGDYRKLKTSNSELQSKIDVAAATEKRMEIALESAKDESRSLESELGRLHETQASTNDVGIQYQQEVEDVRRSLDEAKQTVAELQQYIDGRHASWEALHAKLADQDAAAGEAVVKQDSILAELEQRRDEIEKLGAAIRERDNAKRSLLDEIETLERERDARENDGTDSLKRTLTEQAGQLANDAMTIQDLRAQIDRTESYADSLRRQFQDLMVQTNASGDTHAHLQISLDESKQRNAELHDALMSEKQSVATLTAELKSAIESHAIEVRTIRFELGEAEETLAQNELVSEQLVSDLVDTREFRNELEIILAEKEEQSQLKLDELAKRNRRLERSIASYKQKMGAKSDAVNCLLAELARKDQQLESIDQIKEVIHEIDDGMSERIEERPQSDRDRITRVLIGSIDGQKLRFPLFKNRLTIGRTKQNDIQLEAPYISRRHAVIVTDGSATRIIDWGSKNGVSVNSQCITEHFLKNGDIVKIGTADFKYEERPKRDS